ncbi:MAG: AMP-binding protein [Tidjanibacter sp.]|nr:AMP-binding protein [Tidjanibacter sp.]
MLERYLEKSEFESLEDFMANYKIKTPENFNFGYDIIDEWAAEKPDKKAICWTNDKGECRNYTFAELKDYTDRTASFFSQLGIGKGDTVMLMLKRNVEFWFSIVALHKLGAVAIPATHMLMTKDLIYRNTSAQIKMIVAADDADIRAQVDASLEQSPSLQILVTVGKEDHGAWRSFDKGIENAPIFVRPEHVNDNDDVMLIFFTSGSAGQPKMVAHNFLYPLGHIATAAFWHNLTEDSLHITVADTGWAKAAWGKIYGQWIVGACMFIYDHDKFNAAEMLAMISKHKVTSFCAPPTIYRFLIREDISKYDLSALQYCTTAGEPFNPSVSDEWFEKTGIRVKEGFGQSESTLLVGNFKWMEQKPGSMGYPNPAYRMDIVNKDGESTKVGEYGELVVRIDQGKPVGLFEEYYRNPELTGRMFSNGLYYTGDVAYRDEDGYYWFIGRSDDVIKSSGYRISPFEVESALMSHDAVVECAITGVPDDIRGQVVKATIILAPEYKNADEKALIKEIQEHVKRVSAPYKYPRIIEFVDELPKTISGKIRRVEIREHDKH